MKRETKRTYLRYYRRDVDVTTNKEQARVNQNTTTAEKPMAPMTTGNQSASTGLFVIHVHVLKRSTYKDWGTTGRLSTGIGVPRRSARISEISVLVKIIT